jgi:hypothetical protein
MKTIFNILHQDWIDVVLGIADNIKRPVLFCAAKLLERFRRWTGWKDKNHRTDWIYLSLKRIQAEELLGEYSLHVVRGALSLLIEGGLIERRNNPGNGQDKTYQYRMTSKALESPRFRSESSECGAEYAAYTVESHKRIRSRSFRSTLSNEGEREEILQPERNIPAPAAEARRVKFPENLEEIATPKEQQVGVNIPPPPKLSKNPKIAIATLATSADAWGDGPWRSADGLLDDDFVNWKAFQFQAEYGGDIYVNRAKVMKHYAKSPLYIAIDWRTYHEEQSHRAAAIIITLQSGKAVPDEDKEALSKKVIANPGPLLLEYNAPAAVHEYAPEMAQAQEEMHKPEPDLPLELPFVHEIEQGKELEPETTDLERKRHQWQCFKLPKFRRLIEDWARENGFVIGCDGPELPQLS